MNFNTILYRFGLDPDNFINEQTEPIQTESGFIYEIRQRTDIRICPECMSAECSINNYKTIEISCSVSQNIQDILRIKKVRFKCKNCGTTFTPALKGIPVKQTVSEQVRKLIIADFYSMLSFSDIGRKYGFTPARIVQIFDEAFPEVKRSSLPEVLCIDEKKFAEELDQKYCCILYDFNSKKVVDIIKNRKIPYLKEYFDGISSSERAKVKYFVSDMYDGYATICHLYFPSATHLIDLFHVVKLLTHAVNTLRIRAMNRLDKSTAEYRFMKSRWQQFLKRKEDIADAKFSYERNGSQYHFDEMVFRCIKADKDLLEGYNILQDFYHYNQKRNYGEALEFIGFISDRLINTDISSLIQIGNSFKKWRFEIASTIARSQNKIHYSNSVAENTNAHIQTLIQVSYGYHNFDRFRKRVLLQRTYKKPQ